MKVSDLNQLKNNTALTLRDGTTAFFRGVASTGRGARVTIAETNRSKTTKTVTAQQITQVA